MSNSMIEERFKQIIRENFQTKGPIDNDMNLETEFGMDSIDKVELVIAVEEEFNIEISDEDAESIDTVGAAIDYLKNKAAL